MVFHFTERREAIEKEGVYIGGYGIQQALVATKQDGKYGTHGLIIRKAAMAS